jgi:hypothetical protein
MDMSCKKEGLFDKHHIVPKYKGGTDEFDNMVIISRTCHTMFHYCNWKLWGNKEDHIAYRGLSSQISKEEIIKEISSMSGKRSYENKTGLFALSIEEKKKYSSIGGKKAGKYMSQSMWINDGVKNKRISKTDLLPNGWIMGKVKKKERKKYGRSWNEYMETFDERNKYRLEYLKNVDLTKRGIKTKIANDWGVSRAQVNRFLEKHYSPST